MRIGVKSAADFLALLVRRKWWVIAPFVALSCIVTILVKELPRIYVSESLILVKPRDVPQTFVMDLISGSVQQRLRSIEATVRSRQNIAAILYEFKDRLPEFSRLNIDEAVERLRSQIEIKFDLVFEGQASTVSSFRIRFFHRDPEVAKDIDSKLTTLFLDQDNRTRESNVFGTTEFMSTELEKAESDLAASDDRLKILRTKFQPALPELMAANLAALTRLNDQKKLNFEALERLRTLRQTIEERLAAEPESLSLTAAPKKPLSAEIEAFKKLKDEYDTLKAKLPANSPLPELGIAKLHMERAQAKLTPEEIELALKPASAPTGDDGKPLPNPTYLNLKNQLREIDNEIALKTKERGELDAENRKYIARIDSTPGVELQLTEAIRENNDLRKQYDNLKDKLTAARLSESLESKQRGSQFSVLDKANLPIEPDKPNKWGILAAGLFVSLAISIGIAFVSDVLRQRVWTQSEIEAFWGVPVMVDIPQIVTDADVAVAQRKKWVAVASSLVAVAVFGVCLYLIYLRTPYILEQLDPVLQKVVYR